MLENDQKLKKFVPLILDSIVYPVVLDANRTVLSLPPIINGAHSAVRESPAGKPTRLVGEALHPHCRGTVMQTWSGALCQPLVPTAAWQAWQKASSRV